MSDDNATLPYPAADAAHPTLVIPDDQRPAVEGPTGRRRRWPWVVLIVLVVLVLLAVAAELVARAVLPGVVRSIVIEQLDLPSDQQLDVQAQGVLLPQLMSGSLDSLRLSTDSLTLQGVTGAVDVTATGVPLDGGALGEASGTIRIDAAQLTMLLDDSDLPVDEVTFDAPNATAAGSVSVLGIAIPFTFTATPGVVDGALEFTPVRVTLGEIELDADQVDSALGTLGQRLTGAQRVCVADQLPAGLTLTGLAIVADTAVIEVDVDGAIVTDDALQGPGVCQG